MQKKQSKSTKIRWHQLLGSLLKELLTPIDITVLTDVPVLSEPPEADILLLKTNHNKWTQEQKARLPDGIRDSHAIHILLEFKYSESVNKKAFQQTLSYDYFYQVGQKMKTHEVQTFLISSKTPMKTTLQEFAYSMTDMPGVYMSKNPILNTIPLILLNELSNEPHNAWIKCFASQIKEKKAAFNTLNRMGFSLFNNDLKWIVKGLMHYFKIGGKNMEELTPERLIEYGKEWDNMILSAFDSDIIRSKFSLKYLLKELGPKEILKEFAPEERLEGLAPKERLKGLAPKERLEGLAPEERLEGLAPEDIEKYLKKLKKKQVK